MATVNAEDKAVAARIYGQHAESISVKCVGCIAEIIAEYRETIVSERLVPFCLGHLEDSHD